MLRMKCNINLTCIMGKILLSIEYRSGTSHLFIDIKTGSKQYLAARESVHDYNRC